MPRALTTGAVVLALTSAASLVVSLQAAEPSPTEVRITAAGDYATGAQTDGVLSGVAAAGPDAHLALGDLKYASAPTEQAWCDYVLGKVGAGFPFELVSGNHESNGENGNINDFSACLPNQLPGVVGVYGRQWYVDVPQVDPLVRIVMISPGLAFPDGTTWSYAAGTPRLSWTVAAIDGARAAQIPWVVVGQHKPCLSVGQYGCDSSPDLLNTLVAKKVDLVLSGHEHLYQRTKQLATGGACGAIQPGAYNPACVADADDDLVRGAGTVLATVGTGGVALRDVNPADAEAGYHDTWSGLNANPTWGFVDIRATRDRLTAGFVPTSGGTYTDAFTITAGGPPPANVAPAAVIAAPACTDLSCAFDGSGSSDTDGSVTGWAWDFGDGTTGTGASTSRTYVAAGTYTVRLTVTDDDGATSTVTRSVTVSSGASPPLAADAFSRTVVNGLGRADVGGAWSVYGATSAYAVSAGAARITMAAPGAGPGATLRSVLTDRADVTLRLAQDRLANGSGTYLSVLGRMVPSAGEYGVKLTVRSTGAMTATMTRQVGSTSTSLASANVPGATYTPGDVLRVRLQVVGTGPTVLRAKVWRDGASEPAAWLLDLPDTATALQAPGSVGVLAYLSSGSTTSPVQLTLDDLRVTMAP